MLELLVFFKQVSNLGGEEAGSKNSMGMGFTALP